MRYPRFFASIMAASILAGCAGNSQTEHHTPPDEKMVQAAEASAATADLNFQTAETIEASSVGLLGDGITDNTALFKALLGNGNRTIHIEAGDYVTGRLEIPSNTILKLDPGVIIRDSGQLEGTQRLINIRGENVRIDGLGARVVANRTDYTTGEQRHGIYIYGAQRVLIDGLLSAGHGGDGFYMGGPPGRPSTDITLRGCSADNNRRQGLSITSARRVLVVDSEFTNTRGTAPQFGVDLEPNDPVDFIDDVTFLRPRTSNNQGGGIMIYLDKLDPTSYRVSISIVEHDSAAESPRLRTKIPETIAADVRYSQAQ